MKWQFVVIHTVCQTEILALPDSGVTNTPSVKMCPQTSCLSVCFHMNTLTYLLIYLLNYLLTYLLTHSLTYLLTAWSIVLLEKLTGSQLVKKFPAF